MLLQLLGLPPGETELKQLSLPDLKSLASRLIPNVTVNVTQELKDAAVALLADQSIHKVAELIRSPESIKQLIGMLTGKHQAILVADAGNPANAVMHRGILDCEVCGFANLIAYKDEDLPKAFVCVHCSHPNVKVS